MSIRGGSLGNYYVKLPIEDESKEEGEVAQESETIACHVCDRVFVSKKALHGHMRSHPARRGCGSVTPSMEEETAELLLLLSGSGDPRHRKYLCHGCHEEFETRHALEGHRASHQKRQECHTKDSGRRRDGRSDDEAAGQPAAAESSRRGRKNKRPLLDLNKPPSPSSSSPSGSNDGSGGRSESSSSGDAGGGGSMN
ncbi:zinc finger protein ZAT6-like [Zingiber officinale]|uniref:zinc finger protein ZAT6-like n=1 Tax=Zingiber officinale TaxID=94328 RepID=UPI001C4B6644|nr:zinc finger protein ZAT6-like [Zingiber officinale]